MKPFEEWPEVMNVKTVAECTGLPIPVVYKIFAKKDFPVVDDRPRFRVVGKYVLREYLNKGVKV